MSTGPGSDSIAQRFELGRCLGSGGFGVVYEAYDRVRGARVALKELVSLDASALYRFKEEFRGLRDVTHDNLVSLHELFCVDGRWYLTMDLVEGADLLAWVRAAGPAGPGRLRTALTQLVHGVQALHSAGRLHRDLKPQNVIVTPAGRVVILDFGMLGHVAARDQSVQHAVGTPAYMAPEQLRDEPATEATDWYAVGCLMYEALTGELPFSGTLLSVAREKGERDGPDPAVRAPGAPPDLCALCAALLLREPAARPGGDAILRALGDEPAARSGGLERTAPFVGRAAHLAALREAYRESRRGRAVVVHLHGTSGMGKSGLARRFLDELAAAEPGLVTLEGRCYEREAVPYKAVDSLIDALGRHLLRLDDDVAGLLPRDAGALGRLFPVLLRVQRIDQALRSGRPAYRRDASPSGRKEGSGAGSRGRDLGDPHELRRRGFSALRELLARLGDRAPLVLLLDDLQWGDRDSAALLAELLKPPDAPAMLLLACYRSEDARTGDLLPRLPRPDGDTVREVEVGPLEPAEAEELAAALLRAGGPPAANEAGADAAPAPPDADAVAAPGTASDVAGPDAAPAHAMAEAATVLLPRDAVNGALIDTGDAAAAIARESGGSPFFVQELTRALLDGRVEALSLGDVVAARLGELPEAARRLLEVTALAGQPIATRVAQEVAGLDGNAGHTALSLLRAASLVRLRVAEGLEELETYHDRIREAVTRALDPATLPARHAALAAALEAAGGDPEALAPHFRAAGDRDRARHHAERAAERAAAALAFLSSTVGSEAWNSRDLKSRPH